jgi:hypothetical protein
MEFQEFPKMARLSREVIVTEKIDGTNAQVCIYEIPGYDESSGVVAQRDGLAMRIGSRTRWITPDDDNFGFARWAQENADSLFRLGVGRHFGEWYGSGIQRNYGLQEKRLALFNVSRWDDAAARPTCCHVVPTLWRGNFSDLDTGLLLDELAALGSHAAPGFMKPEGIVVFHVAAGIGFKRTIHKDEIPKSVAEKFAGQAA